MKTISKAALALFSAALLGNTAFATDMKLTTIEHGRGATLVFRPMETTPETVAIYTDARGLGTEIMRTERESLLRPEWRMNAHGQLFMALVPTE